MPRGRVDIPEGKKCRIRKCPFDCSVELAHHCPLGVFRETTWDVHDENWPRPLPTYHAILVYRRGRAIMHEDGSSRVPF
jgi:hypothetical protein